MGSKSSVEMCTGLGNFLIFSECSLSFTPPLVSTCVQWYFALDSCIIIFCYFCSSYLFRDKNWFVMQMTVLVVYIFLYGRAYLVSDNLNHNGEKIILSSGWANLGEPAQFLEMHRKGYLFV